MSGASDLSSDDANIVDVRAFGTSRVCRERAQDHCDCCDSSGGFHCDLFLAFLITKKAPNMRSNTLILEGFSHFEAPIYVTQ